MTSALLMCYVAICLYSSVAMSVFIFDAKKEANEFLCLINSNKRVSTQSALVLCIGATVVSIFFSLIILYSVMYDYSEFKDSFTRTLSNRMKRKGYKNNVG